MCAFLFYYFIPFSDHLIKTANMMEVVNMIRDGAQPVIFSHDVCSSRHVTFCASHMHLNRKSSDEECGDKKRNTCLKWCSL